MADVADMLFAIGAYYASFPGKSTNMLHEHYFRHAVALSNAGSVERSINKVSFLLAECFYLLAVCRTDRWAESHMTHTEQPPRG